MRNPNLTVTSEWHYQIISKIIARETNRCATRGRIRDARRASAHLSEILVDAPEVCGALAMVVHDVAAELPDGPLELVAVELELREAAPDAVERVQQRVGLLPHALLDGRHDGVLGVEPSVLLLVVVLLLMQRLRVDADEGPVHRPFVLRANQNSRLSLSGTGEIGKSRGGSGGAYLAAARVVKGAPRVGGQAEGARDGGGGGGARGGGHAWAARGGVLGFWDGWCSGVG